MKITSILSIITAIISTSALAAPIKLSEEGQKALTKAKACLSIAKEANADATEVCGDLLKVEGVLPAILDEMTMDPTNCLNNASRNFQAERAQCAQLFPAGAERNACFNQAQSTQTINRNYCMQAQQNYQQPNNVQWNFNVGTPSIKK